MCNIIAMAAKQWLLTMKKIQDQLYLDSESEYEPESSGSSDDFDDNE